MTVTAPKLFTPIQVGDCALQHRMVLPPLTRNRATKAHVPTDLQVEYYAQRGSTPGTLLITEGTFIAPQAGGYPHVPGIWNDDQVAGWKRVIWSHGPCDIARAHIPLGCAGDGRGACTGIVHFLPAVGTRTRSRAKSA